MLVSSPILVFDFLLRVGTICEGHTSHRMPIVELFLTVHLGLIVTGTWQETDLKPSSYLSSFASLFSSNRAIASSSTSFSSSTSQIPSSPSEVISFASYLQEDTLGLAFSLSRDRKLRVWNLVTGACVRTVDVIVRGGNALVARGGPTSQKVADLLLPSSEAGPNSFLRVIASRDLPSSAVVAAGSTISLYDYHLAVFLPFSSTASSSGGRFVFYGIQVDAARSQFGEIVAVGEKSCPAGTGGAELRDFDFVLGGAEGEASNDPSSIWAVWDVRGETVLQRSGIDDVLEEKGSSILHAGEDISEDGWETLRSPPTPAFTSTYFEELLQSTEQSPASLFITHLFYPSRFSPLSLHTSLDAYVSSLISHLPPSSSSHPAALSASYGSLAERVAATVGCHIQVERSPHTGELLRADFDKRIRSEWLGFLARVEEAERDARWAVGIVKTEGGNVAIIQRDGIIVPSKKSSVEIISSLVSSPEESSRSSFLSTLPGTLHISHPSLAPPQTRRAAIFLATLGQSLASLLPSPAMLLLESDLTALSSSALSLSVEDVVLDLFGTRIEPYLHEGNTQSIRGDLGAAGESFQSAVKTVLDWVISPSDPLLSPSALSPGLQTQPSNTAVSLIASSLRITLELRFILARNILLVLLFAISEAPEEDLEVSPLMPLVSSALSVVQCLGNLRWIGGVTGDDSTSRLRNGPSPEDSAFLDRFDSLKMSNEKQLASQPTSQLSSLLHSLLANSTVTIASPASSSPSYPISSSTSAFLSTTSLASLRTLVQALPEDVELAEKLLVAGHVKTAYEYCQRFPLEEGLAFVKAKAALVLGKIDESETLFEKVAAAFSE